MSLLPGYVLITPARNEAQYIENTIRSVVSQTVLPIKWVIVSDGSTDSTDSIVQQYVEEYPWIELARVTERRERHFAGKVHAFNAGFARVKGLDFAVVGSLDADISFDESYFEYLLGKLAADSRLGLVGTPFTDEGHSTYDYRYTNIEHVSGACQLFRRECYEAIGGYVPVRGGCIDHIAVVTARMMGWKTHTFTDKISLHHRAMGTAEQSVLKAKFANGAKDYAIGNHPVWEMFRACYQMKQRPILVGGLLIISGYIWASIVRHERPVSFELVKFVRHEQMERLKKFLCQKMSRRPRGVESAAGHLQ